MNKVAAKVAALVFMSSLPISSLYAAQVPFDFTHCYSAKATDVLESEDAVVQSFELTGIMLSHTDAKMFDSATSHCVGVIKGISGEYSFLAYCKLMSPNEDYIVYEQAEKPGDKTWDWVVIASGGKWKGATGNGKSTRITKAKGILEGTNQQCNRHEGTITLP